MDLQFDDWLDGIEKTVQNSIKEAQDKESEGNFMGFLFYIILAVQSVVLSI